MIQNKFLINIKVIKNMENFKNILKDYYIINSQVKSFKNYFL